MDTLLNCCSRRKSFVIKLYEKQLESCLLQALRGNSACQSALCLMLEWNLVKESDQQMLITTTLQSTESGTQQYDALCKRQQHLKKIVRKIMMHLLLVVVCQLAQIFFKKYENYILRYHVLFM